MLTIHICKHAILFFLSTICRQGTHSTDDLSVVIQNRWKLRFPLIRFRIKWSPQNFAHDMTAMLPWHLQIFVRFDYPQWNYKLCFASAFNNERKSCVKRAEADHTAACWHDVYELLWGMLNIQHRLSALRAFPQSRKIVANVGPMSVVLGRHRSIVSLMNLGTESCQNIYIYIS